MASVSPSRSRPSGPRPRGPRIKGPRTVLERGSASDSGGTRGSSPLLGGSGLVGVAGGTGWQGSGRGWFQSTCATRFMGCPTWPEPSDAPFLRRQGLTDQSEEGFPSGQVAGCGVELDSGRSLGNVKTSGRAVQGPNHRCHRVLSLHALRPGDGQRSAGAPSGAEIGRCISPRPAGRG